jgi:hypothetical protein
MPFCYVSSSSNIDTKTIYIFIDSTTYGIDKEKLYVNYLYLFMLFTLKAVYSQKDFIAVGSHCLLLRAYPKSRGDSTDYAASQDFSDSL